MSNRLKAKHRNHGVVTRARKSLARRMGIDTPRRGRHDNDGGGQRELTTHTVDGELRRILKPRDRSRYTPAARNGTPRRLHAREGR